MAEEGAGGERRHSMAGQATAVHTGQKWEARAKEEMEYRNQDQMEEEQPLSFNGEAKG